MNSYFDALGLTLNSDSSLATARRTVLESTPWNPTPTTHVSYVAANRLLIVGNAEQAAKTKSLLPDKIVVYVAVPNDRSKVSMELNTHNCADLTVDGYLGRFEVHIDSTSDDSKTDENNLALILGIQSGVFDQVLDFSENPLINAAIKPPGYYYLNSIEEGDLAFDTCIENIPELIGEFEKPKFFNYNPDICAHGRSGISGCTNCLDACPTDAIISIGEQIEVNPHLCQGGGSCTARCPTGAITYLYPKAEEQLELLRKLIIEFRKAGAPDIELLIFDSENSLDDVTSISENLADHVLPFIVEEIGSVGLDLLIPALVWGADRIRLYVPEDIAPPVQKAIQTNCEIVDSFLTELGLNNDGNRVVEIISSLSQLDSQQGVQSLLAQHDSFAPIGNKRTTIRSGILHLYKQSDQSPETISLPDSAPFGKVLLEDSKCTLCMGCVSVCPASALQAGGESPALKFIESNCVQCGICSRACPESAITLQAGYNLEAQNSSQPVALKEEEAFRCISCGKPFATKAMISRMTEKLSGHWMFEKPQALNRLQMCEDCRVADMFKEEGLGA